MKKTHYIIACFLGFTSVTFGQTSLKVSSQPIADVTVLNNELVLYTQKDNDGQFIYTENMQGGANPKKDLQLNKGVINAIAGKNSEANQIYVYQKYNRKKDAIVVFEWKDNAFQQVSSRLVPKVKNNSANLGYFLSEDQQYLFISAELRGSQGQDDLYVCTWDGKGWSKPKSLGSTVNTRHAEFAPFVTGDKLFFSRQEGEMAYVYGVTLKNGSETIGEASKLDNQVNLANAFNAYYKKEGENEVWITASAEKGYTAYYKTPVQQKVEEAPVAEKAVEKPVEKPAAVTEMKFNPSFKLHYKLNQVSFDEEAKKALDVYLLQLPDGARLQIKGYSDGLGSDKVKERVSRNRALQLQEYIEKRYSEKGFNLSITNEVLQVKGNEYRFAELKATK